MAVTSGSVYSNSLNSTRFYVDWQLNKTATDSNGQVYSLIDWQYGIAIDGIAYWYSNSIIVNSLNIDGGNYLTATYSNVSGNGKHQLSSGQARVYHNQTTGEKTFNINVNGSLYGYGNVSGSANFELPPIPRYANITNFTVTPIDETSVKYNYSVDHTCDKIWYTYRKSGETEWSDWYDLPSNHIITELEANTRYVFQLIVRRKSNQLITYSDLVRTNTYDYPHANIMPDFTIGNELTIGLYNPVGRNITVTMLGDDNSEIITKETNTTSITNFNDLLTIDNLYKSIPNNISGIYKIKVDYEEISSRTEIGGNYTIAYKTEEYPQFLTTDWSYVANFTDLTNDNQIVIDNYSNIQCTVDTEARPQKYSTITKYICKWGTKSTDAGISKNLFNKMTATENYRLDNKGLPYADNNCFLSDFIEVEPNTVYTKNNEPSVYKCVALYDENQTFISRNTTTSTFTTTSETRYVRITDYKTNIDNLQIEQGETSSEYQKYGKYVGLIEKGNGLVLNVTAVDSRGLQTTTELSLGDNLIEYTNITLNSISADRDDGIEETVRLNLEGNLYDGLFGINGVFNTIYSAKYWISENGTYEGDGYSINTNSFTLYNGKYTLSDYVIHPNGVSGGFQNGKTYYVKVEVKDGNGNQSLTTGETTIADGKFARDTYKDINGEYHFGINGLANSNYTEIIHGTLNVTNGIYVDGQEIGGASSLNEYSDSTVNPYSADYVNKLNSYSATSEIKVGTWLDGRPLYQKTIQVTKSISAGNDVVFNHGIDNIREICDIKTNFKAGWSQFWGNDGYMAVASIGLRCTTTQVTIQNSSANFNNCVYTITFKYTKTTD